MKNLFLSAVLMLAMISCSGPKKEQVKQEQMPSLEEKIPGQVSIVTNSMDIVMPDTLHAGLNQLVYENRSNMVHLLLFNKVPDSISVEDYAEQLTKPFQAVMDAINNEQEPPNNFPQWLESMVNMGGIGLLSPGKVAESFVDLEAGNYVVECYIKSNGVFHSSTGMLKQVQVIPGSDVAEKPNPTVKINLSAEGIALDGQIPQSAGEMVFQVSHGETRLFDNFTRPDVNLARISDETKLSRLEDYMDWRKPDGMVIEAPVEFLGGAQEMPQGKVSYFKANLEPGRYVLIGEVPQPKADGFYHEFEVK